MAAVIAVMTGVIKLPVPATGGYVHPGDGAIFLAASLMGSFAALPAAIGSALADILGGYAAYALPTALIKGCMGYLAGKLMGGKALSFRNALVFILCEAIMITGYFAFEWAMYGVAAAIGAVGPNLIQGAAGVILGCVLSGAGNALKRKF